MSHTVLGVGEGRFTVNKKPTFLVGMSYYGALGAPREFIERDLQDIRRARFQWIRVWATWNAFDYNVSAIDEQGNPREPFMSKLRWLVERCDRFGLIVDVTLTRGKPPLPSDLQTHKQAVVSLVDALKSFRNWYIDLANERNVRDDRFVSFDDLRDLRETVAHIDPQRLVTASEGGDIDRDSLRAYLQKVQVSLVCPHRPRDAQSLRQTEAKTREYLQWMREEGRIAPLHYQEPFRRGYGQWQPVAEDFLIDLRGARDGGAAGWCLHNGDQRSQADGKPRRSFDMREKRLFEQLDEEERKVVTAIERGKW